MPTLTIRDVPDALYYRLRARAEEHGRSLAEEVIGILAEASGEPASLSILGLKGLGKHIWQGIDAGAYVEEERRTWD